MSGEADALELPPRLGEKAGLFPAIQPENGSERALAAAQVGADRNVFQRRHFGAQLHMLECARNAELGDLARGKAADGLAAQAYLAGVRAQHRR